jgi:hypothetical protein
VVERAAGLGLTPEQVVASPLLGPDGNREFFVALRNAPGTPANGLDQAIRDVARCREAATR